MAHNIFGQRTLQYKKPAWHRLTEPLQEPMAAVAALEKMGEYVVYTEQIQTVSGIEIPMLAILRAPVPDDNETVVFGTCSPDYGLITPRDTCQIWDDAVGQPIESIGALGRGERFFITCEMKPFDVKGDEIKNFLLAVNPMTGGDAAKVRVTPVRVVCENTLIAATYQSVEVYTIIHDRYAKDRLANWLSGAYHRAIDKAQAMEEAFNVLAGHRCPKEELEKIIEAAYPYPAEPKRNVPEEVYEKRMQAWGWEKKHLDSRRVAAREAFDGNMLGGDTEAVKGTAWGAWNAITFTENYRLWHNPRSAAEQILLGSRADVMERAYVAALNFSKN